MIIFFNIILPHLQQMSNNLVKAAPGIMGKWLEKIQEVGHDMLIPNLFSFFFYANGKLGKQIGFGPKKAQNG